MTKVIVASTPTAAKVSVESARLSPSALRSRLFNSESRRENGSTGRYRASRDQKPRGIAPWQPDRSTSPNRHTSRTDRRHPSRLRSPGGLAEVVYGFLTKEAEPMRAAGLEAPARLAGPETR